LQNELGADNLQIIAVAIDEDVEKVKAAAEGINYPVLIDAQHLLSELYGISDVPTVVMIDENDRIARPNWSASGNDAFREFSGIDSDRQHDRIRRWVREGDAGTTEDEARAAVPDYSADDEAAQLHFRVAAELRRRGDDEGAARNFDRAAELAPHDWTIRRAMLPLRGEDPFGQGFFDLYGEHQAAGSPYRGLHGY